MTECMVCNNILCTECPQSSAVPVPLPCFKTLCVHVQISVLSLLREEGKPHWSSLAHEKNKPGIIITCVLAVSVSLLLKSACSTGCK